MKSAGDRSAPLVDAMAFLFLFTLVLFIISGPEGDSNSVSSQGTLRVFATGLRDDEFELAARPEQSANPSAKITFVLYVKVGGNWRSLGELGFQRTASHGSIPSQLVGRLTSEMKIGELLLVVNHIQDLRRLGDDVRLELEMTDGRFFQRRAACPSRIGQFAGLRFVPNQHEPC